MLVATWDKKCSHSSEHLEKFTAGSKWGEGCLSPLGYLVSPCGNPTESLGSGAAQGFHQLSDLWVIQIHGGVAGKAEKQPALLQPTGSAIREVGWPPTGAAPVHCKAQWRLKWVPPGPGLWPLGLSGWGEHWEWKRAFT